MGSAWVALLLAGLFEVAFTTCLRLSDGFTRLGWSIAFAVAAILSFGFLSIAQRTIPLGTAYAVWVGVGAVGTLLVGVGFFAERPTTLQWVLVFGIVACVVGIKLSELAKG
jgi:quaternary ammonium compound-resistance protein SugE